MTKKEIDFINKNFRLTWEPNREKIKPYLLKRKRMTVTFEKLTEIIGEKRAIFIAKNLSIFKNDKIRYFVQNKGKLDVYSK